MSGVGHKFAPVTRGRRHARFSGAKVLTALLVVLALCWPMATALAAASTAPAQHSCCMRMSHACHSQQQPGDKFEAVCRTCGWCHALPNARAHQSSIIASFHVSSAHAALHVESESQPSLAPSRLHASRAPPFALSLAGQES